MPKKRKYSFEERKAYWIGVGYGARSVSGTGMLSESFKKGASTNANVSLYPHKTSIKRSK